MDMKRRGFLGGLVAAFTTPLIPKSVEAAKIEDYREPQNAAFGKIYGGICLPPSDGFCWPELSSIYPGHHGTFHDGMNYDGALRIRFPGGGHSSWTPNVLEEVKILSQVPAYQGHDHNNGEFAVWYNDAPYRVIDSLKKSGDLKKNWPNWSINERVLMKMFNRVTGEFRISMSRHEYHRCVTLNPCTWYDLRTRKIEVKGQRFNLLTLT